jgi:hypothetical protein
MGGDHELGAKGFSEAREETRRLWATATKRDGGVMDKWHIPPMNRIFTRG